MAIVRGVAASDAQPVASGRRELTVLEATGRLCPFLVDESGAWRSAMPRARHRCAAVLSSAPIPIGRQRAVCVTPGHLECATFRAARSRPGSGIVAGPGDISAGPVTRWALARTIPTVMHDPRSATVRRLAHARAIRLRSWLRFLGWRPRSA